MDGLCWREQVCDHKLKNIHFVFKGVVLAAEYTERNCWILLKFSAMASTLRTISEGVDNEGFVENSPKDG